MTWYALLPLMGMAFMPVASDWLGVHARFSFSWLAFHLCTASLIWTRDIHALHKLCTWRSCSASLQLTCAKLLLGCFTWWSLADAFTLCSRTYVQSSHSGVSAWWEKVWRGPIHGLDTQDLDHTSPSLPPPPPPPPPTTPHTHTHTPHLGPPPCKAWKWWHAL